jgi:hypothetical protein
MPLFVIRGTAPDRQRGARSFRHAADHTLVLITAAPLRHVGCIVASPIVGVGFFRPGKRFLVIHSPF